MSQQDSKANNRSNPIDEIDFRMVYNGAKGIIAALWDSIVAVFLFAKKRWAFMLIFSVLGLGCGAGLFKITKPTYISTLTLSSNVLANDYCADIIQELELIVGDDTPKLLAQKLKIDTNSAKAIKRIEFFNYDEKLKEKYKDKDTIVLGRPFKIKVSAFSNTVFDTLQVAIVNYLENNEYATKRKEIKKQENIMMRQKINEEIKQLDSLKEIVSSSLAPRGNSSGFVFGQPIDPVNIYKEGIIFFQKELDLNKEMVLMDNIQVISDFSARDKPDSPRLFKNLTLGIIAGFLFGLVIAVMLEKRES